MEINPQIAKPKTTHAAIRSRNGYSETLGVGSSWAPSATRTRASPLKSTVISRCSGSCERLRETTTSSRRNTTRPRRKTERVVYSKRPFGGPEAVLAYLSRYTHRVAISNRRLVAANEKGITFKWKDYRIGAPVGGEQKSPILLIGAFKQVPARSLGAGVGGTFQVVLFGKHIAKPFTSALLFAVV
jgi:Putative transposase